jgi:hypothetical protein
LDEVGDQRIRVADPTGDDDAGGGALHIKIANADDDAPLGRRVIVLSSALRLSPSASEDHHGERRIQCSTAIGPPLPSCCMLRDSKNAVPTGRYGRDGDAVW